MKLHYILVILIALLLAIPVLIFIGGATIYVYNRMLDNFVQEQKEDSLERIEQKEKMQYQGIFESLECWERGHEKSEYSKYWLMKVYAETVDLYGQMVSYSECIDLIQNLLDKYDSYNQTILGDYIIIPLDENLARVEFVKQIVINGKSNEYKAYLVFRKFEELIPEWRIIKESDTQTDAYFERLKNKKTRK